MKDKMISTIWLDFINFIFIPFYILTNIIDITKLLFKFNFINIILIIIHMIIIIFSIYTLYNLKKETNYLIY